MSLSHEKFCIRPKAIVRQNNPSAAGAGVRFNSHLAPHKERNNKPMINWIKQIFCKHDYQLHIKKAKFVDLNGTRVYEVCTKCGKVQGSHFWNDL